MHSSDSTPQTVCFHFEVKLGAVEPVSSSGLLAEGEHMKSRVAHNSWPPNFSLLLKLQIGAPIHRADKWIIVLFRMNTDDRGLKSQMTCCMNGRPSMQHQQLPQYQQQLQHQHH